MKKVTLSLVLLLFAMSLFAQAPRPFPAWLAPCLEDDFRELEKFYDATNGDKWVNKENWFTSPDLESWYGIYLTASGCDVNQIVLNNNNLNGQLIDFKLPALTTFNIEYNQLTGSIPDFTNLSNLSHFYCGVNQLTDSIPDFKNLPNLHRFNCIRNQLTGSIPDFKNLPNLTDFYCIINQLSSSIPDFKNLPNLTDFVCTGNQLSGNIPDFKNLPKLVSLSCRNNQLSGSIPDFKNLPNLIDFDCSFNQLSGTIPDFKNLPNLIGFNCGINQLTGSIPDFTNLPNLIHFYCSVNQLTGSIPDFKNLLNLSELGCGVNQLTGSIPDFKSTQNLINFRCDNNQLTGSIPDFKNLPNLIYFNCSFNQLSGSIPDFKKLSYLASFFCNNNQLIGNIPDFKNLPNLVSFDCYNNQLTGSIPDFTNLLNLKYFRCNNNQLTGNIPNFLSTTKLSLLYCKNNLFNFGNFDAIAKNTLLFNSDFSYSPQNTKPPISYKNNTLVADTAGATLDKLTYTWYRNQQLYKVVANSNVLPNIDKTGKYFYAVRNNTLTQLTLTSDTIQIGARIVAKVFADSNKDCILNNNEKGRKSIIIRFENVKDTVTTVSDINGNFEISLDTLSYKMFVKTGNLWTTCALPIIKPTSWNDSLNLNIPMQAIVDCPSLEVSLSTQRLRRCFDNTYIVKYANRGTVVANNAHVVVDFDKWLQVKSATKSYTQFPNNRYRFDVGNLAVDEEGTFSVVVKVDCDSTVLGQTHCSTAHIYPDTICVNPTLWDKSSLDIKATCINGKLRFEVKNIGTAPNSQALQSIVVEDQIMMFQTPINLNPGGIKSFDFTPQGKTVRVQVEQAAYHPSGNAYISAAVEGCGGNPTLGMITQFSQNDNEPFIDIDCRQNIGAYDPNEKTATPVGYKNTNKIEPNTNITYQIDFQNQGSDTAFTVVLRDTIDQNFDLTTLNMGASSHPYSWTIENKNTLKVTFDTINLTTKKQDEAKSQGFVQYEIAQKRDLKLGKTLKNRAGIYFDFNLPIMTNTVKHSIDKNYVTLVAVPDLIVSDIKVNVVPNPFRDEAIFSIKNTDNQSFSLKIFDNLGRIIHQQTSDNGRINYQNTAQSGIYYYRIEQNGKVGSGKLIVQ